MYHDVQFTENLLIDVERSAKDHLERTAIREGSRARVQIKPYVIETDEGPVEVADLFFEDGTATRRVSFDSFFFVE